MKRFLINFFILFACFSFLGCEKEEAIFFSSDELIAYCEVHTDYKKLLKETKLCVKGKVAWISYPKDGRNLNECAIYLETRNSIPEKRTGDFIACHMIERIQNSLIGETVIINGKFSEYEVINNEKYVIIKKCKIIQDLKSDGETSPTNRDL